MGAATALLHGDRDPSIAALVLDSAFADLTQLAEEMVDRGRQAVRLVVVRWGRTGGGRPERAAGGYDTFRSRSYRSSRRRPYNSSVIDDNVMYIGGKYGSSCMP